MIRMVLKWLTGGVIDRAMSSVDKYVEAQTDRDKIKAEIIKEHMRTRGDWLRSGGVWLMLPFIAVVFFHFAAVAVYSVFWCAACAYPKPWSIAALPAPMDQWEAWIIMAAIGGLGLLGARK